MLLAPAFLIGLLAIGLPLWLHRFSRHADTRRPFASLMLLEPSEVQRSRKQTLRYLLLLALRIGLLAALVLAFAEPVLPWRSPPADASRSRLHVIVLDTSLSMNHGERWKRAVEQAGRLIDGMTSGDRAMLVTADAVVQVRQQPVPRSEAEQLRSTLATLRPGLARLDYGMLMTSARSWIGATLEPVRLHLITDLQRSASPLRFADLEPPPGVELDLVDVGDAQASDLRIESVEPSARDAADLEVRIGGAAVEGERREVALSVDGREHGRRSIDLQGPGPYRVLFDDIDAQGGDHRVTASLVPHDALPQNDDGFAVLRRTEPRVLIIAANPAADDAAYLAAAVGSLTNPRLAVERVSPDAVARRSLVDFSTVIVSDAGVLSTDAARQIETYLQGGGAVLMTLGPRAAALQTLPVSGHAITGGLQQQSARDRTSRVSLVDESHPALREAQGWRSVRFLRHVPIEPREGDTVLMSFESGAPLLVERRMGQGRLLVFTSPLDREWNDLAIHPLFVRFIGDAARYLTGANSPASSATVGTLLSSGLNGRGGAQIFDPRGRRVLTLDDTAGSVRLRPDQTGFYELRGSGRVDWIAVNVDPRESQLERMAPAQVERWKALRAADSGPAGRGGDGTMPAVKAPELKPLWLWLLMAAVALAFIEPIVANYHLHVRREAGA